MIIIIIIIVAKSFPSARPLATEQREREKRKSALYAKPKSSREVISTLLYWVMLAQENDVENLCGLSVYTAARGVYYTQ